MLIDTHCHLCFNAYKDDVDTVIQRAFTDDIHMVVPGSQRDTSARAVALADRYEQGVYAAVGLHPAHVHSFNYDDKVGDEKIQFVTREEEYDQAYYRSLAQSSKKVVAIGEIGIDNFIVSQFEDRERVLTDQIAVLGAQLDLADELELPVIIHSRNSTDVILEILRRRYPGGRPHGGVAHFFADAIDVARSYFDLGFLISFTGVITFAKEYHEVIKTAPLEKIMIETDSPYVTPHPYRGKRNEPSNVRYIAETIAQIKGVSFEDVARQTTQNAIDLFQL
ncbi:MAG: Mg-dependent DNAse [Parcubacteria group bacterium GW2011_GWA2_47_8]|nr:MAG: Mg-dependent DNAse [Parcubacteria group bacterium GW2011_GWA2_47_8]